jgi:hypothetical protein
MIPPWLHVLSIAALALGALCALLIALDESRHPQHMWIMNVVWPITALFGTLVWLWGYFRYGRLTTHERMHTAKQASLNEQKPFPIIVGEGTSHCGAGCTLGDICAEWLAFAVPGIPVALGWHSIFTEKMLAVWILDFLFAYLFGIVFQYFTIALRRRPYLRQSTISNSLNGRLELAFGPWNTVGTFDS